MNKKLPQANAVATDSDNHEEEKLLSSGRFSGLANNTKWNELINEIRSWESWHPSFRSKCINGYVAAWEVDWFYHLPFPFKYTLWLDLGCHQKTPKGDRMDRTDELVKLVTEIGFNYEVRGDILRILGYAPRDYEDF